MKLLLSMYLGMGEMSGVHVDNQFQSSENSLVDRMQTTSHASRLMRQVSAAVPSSKCMKAVLMMVLVCVVFLCGFALGCLSVGATSSGQSDALQYTTPFTPEDTPTAATTPEGTELQTQAATLHTTPQQSQVEEWKRNKDLLVSLGCRPRPTAVQIPQGTSHGDQTLSPTHLVVERCLKNSSFCGKPEFGEANGMSAGESCVPSLIEVEEFQVMYLREGSPVTVLVPMEVHKNCICDKGIEGTLNDG